MSSITIYLEDALEARLRESASKEGISVSKLVAKLVDERTSDTWPTEFMALAGSWQDIDRPVHSADSQREVL